jgi:hypothetical protein
MKQAELNVLQALIISGFSFYRWAMNALHPAHPGADRVMFKHAMHNAQLDVSCRSRTRT